MLSHLLVTILETTRDVDKLENLLSNGHVDIVIMSNSIFATNADIFAKRKWVSLAHLEVLEVLEILEVLEVLEGQIETGGRYGYGG